MSKVPSLPYTEILKALERLAGQWFGKRAVISVREAGRGGDATDYGSSAPPCEAFDLITYLKQAGLSVEEFLELL
jgi:hypothetical protein